MGLMVFVNLPVSDLARSVAFHEAMGAKRDARFSDDRAAMPVYSDAFRLMLLDRARFAEFTEKEIIDPKAQVQTLICFSADSRAEVDARVARAVAAGGRKDPGPIQEHGFMYGRSYEDPDGHVFELAWMDMDAIPNAGSPEN